MEKEDLEAIRGAVTHDIFVSPGRKFMRADLRASIATAGYV